MQRSLQCLVLALAFLATLAAPALAAVASPIGSTVLFALDVTDAKLYALSAASATSVGAPRMLATPGAQRPCFAGFDAARGILRVFDCADHFVQSYAVSGDADPAVGVPLTLAARFRVKSGLDRNPRGMAVDVLGNVALTASSGQVVFIDRRALDVAPGSRAATTSVAQALAVPFVVAGATAAGTATADAAAAALAAASPAAPRAPLLQPAAMAASGGNFFVVNAVGGVINGTVLRLPAPSQERTSQALRHTRGARAHALAKVSPSGTCVCAAGAVVYFCGAADSLLPAVGTSGEARRAQLFATSATAADSVVADVAPQLSEPTGCAWDAANARLLVTNREATGEMVLYSMPAVGSTRTDLRVRVAPVRLSPLPGADVRLSLAAGASDAGQVTPCEGLMSLFGLC